MFIIIKEVMNDTSWYQKSSDTLCMEIFYAANSSRIQIPRPQTYSHQRWNKPSDSGKLIRHRDYIIEPGTHLGMILTAAPIS